MSDFKSSILQELQWRGFIQQMTHDGLDEALEAGPLALYCGFDPSGPSLHVGHLLPVLGLAFFKRHGHAPMALVGGATGMIGDPSGKSEERNLLSEEAIGENVKGIQAQLQAILDRAAQMHPETLGEGVAEAGAEVPIVNNADWLKPWSFIDFLREVGKHFRVNAMLAKDSVRSRIEEREQGISFTEFSYQLIQAFDFFQLYEQRKCRLQIGGSDQWGNITAGTDFIRRKLSKAAFGMTFPLVTDSSGNKLGKTAGGGAVWLNPERTSPYEFYQYWVAREDADVPGLLRLFTFLPREEIDALIAEIDAGENRGQVQKKLAWEVTALVHGAEEADGAVRASKMLFGEKIEGLTDRQLASIFGDIPSTEIARAEFEGEGIGILDLMTRTGLQKSNGAARRLIKQGGAYINNEKVDAPEKQVTLADLASESMMVLRSGKKSYHVIRVTD
ncbi:tyrosine--tRNA ligase [Bradymonas sediminis]|uniref:Tyrosine--tRNA ligase n=1 Tax=Bradymonas sediminis TaxID=1548548 RepID=A0A2Z4FIL8_9DELT|nr:tyrosine--tRNA ligase [Bradymonas sediminis]AWV88528.1 tyrosine--tRNA ligase [Bradymonas sediminis]TDP77666.1 tyrosyl-tRNA synthetase [Bradymonas sediminis]